MQKSGKLRIEAVYTVTINTVYFVYIINISVLSVTRYYLFLSCKCGGHLEPELQLGEDNLHSLFCSSILWVHSCPHIFRF